MAKKSKAKKKSAEEKGRPGAQKEENSKIGGQEAGEKGAKKAPAKAAKKAAPKRKARRKSRRLRPLRQRSRRLRLLDPARSPSFGGEHT